MDDGRSERELPRLGYRKATVWVVDHDKQQARELWRDSAQRAAAADERDHSNEIGGFLLDEMLRDES
jgi:hypothetical protein